MQQNDGVPGGDDIDRQKFKKLSTIITDKLSEEIQNGNLKPGERLIQVDLAQRFGVSRVAIRDALMDLRNRGLSVNLPLKGDIVRPVSCKTINEVFALRAIVEAFAVSLAVPRITPASFLSIETNQRAQEAALENGDFDLIEKLDWEFHREIYNHCDNEPLLEVIEMLWARMRQAKSLAKADESWGRSWSMRSVHRHRELVDAIQAGDAAVSSRIAGDNIREASKELMAQLCSLGWDANILS